ncbi:MAG: hypothetical protein CMJ64_23720 [Planctomycetaceae bacterium]|nr:hypothetical protein [Planctomycetaceae bacterium]
MAGGFDDLRVYHLSEDIADTTWDLVLGWNNLAKDTVGKQIIRSADSIGANIAEGYGRGTYNDNKRFVRISRGSLYESRHWLHRAFRRKLLTQDQIDHLKPLIDNLGSQLNAYLKSIGPQSSQ